MSQDELRRWMAWGALLLGVFLAWSNSLGAEFTYDDKVEVIGNSTIRFLERWELVLGYNWSRPITIASYALNYRVGQLEPLTYHVVDLALHGLCAGLAMLLLTAIAEARALARPVVVGVTGAALWALHPLATESVTYITGRSEQLCALFYLLGCWAWLRWSLDGGWQRLFLALIAVPLGLMCKEVAVTMPLAYLLLEGFAQRGGALSELRWRRYVPWALAVVAFLVFRSVVLVGEVAAAPVTGGPYAQLVHEVTGMAPLRPLEDQLFTEAEVIWRYLGLTLLPVGQSIFHDHPVTGLTARSGAAALGLVALTAAAILGRRRAPLLAAGWLWFLLILLPSSSIIPLKETMAEHRALLSMLGVAWVAGAGLARLPLPGGAVLSVCLALALGGLTFQRNAVWATELSLWADAVDKNPGSAEAWYGYGDALRYAGRLPEAKDAYQQAIDMEPGLKDAWANLGIVQARMGDEDEAEQTWRAVLRAHPTFCKAHNNLGLLFARNERPADAAAEFRTTLAYCPRDCRAHRYLGELYADYLDDEAKAILHLETFLELCPSDSMSEEVRAKRDALTW